MKKRLLAVGIAATLGAVGLVEQAARGVNMVDAKVWRSSKRLRRIQDSPAARLLERAASSALEARMKRKVSLQLLSEHRRMTTVTAFWVVM